MNQYGRLKNVFIILQGLYPVTYGMHYAQN